MSDFRPEERQNTNDNVFAGLSVGNDEPGLVAAYLTQHDFSSHTRKAVVSDLRKFACWFSESNKEPFTLKRVTTRDVIDFRNYLRREKKQAVASINRALVLIRRFFDWCVREKVISTNPAKQIKELRRQQLAPKGLDRPDVRRLLREIELRKDIRAGAVFHLLLYTGCRVSDAVKLELTDLFLSERAGSAVFRFGKGNKQRTAPLPLPARRALQSYLEVRPPIASTRVFVGERGAVTDAGVRALCRKYGGLIGVRLHPHIFRHTMAKQFLADNGNDLVSLAQILGHENLNTTSRYSQRNEGQLAEAADRLNY
jgi:site-specific recombinase XerD